MPNYQHIAYNYDLYARISIDCLYARDYNLVSDMLDIIANYGKEYAENTYQFRKEFIDNHRFTIRERAPY